MAGALLGPLLAVQVGMGENILILAFVVIVIGGIGSIRGALVGALLVGMVDTIGRAFLPIAVRARCFPPQVAAHAGPAHRFDADLHAHGGGAVLPAAGPVPGARLMRDTLHPTATLAALGVVAGAAAAGRMLAIDQAFYLGFASRVLIYAIAATSLNLVLGYGGMVTFGHAAFVGAGAYAVAHADRRGRRRSAWIAWPARWSPAALLALRDRRDLAAHARRVLHHDHARLRADAVLPRSSR